MRLLRRLSEIDDERARLACAYGAGVAEGSNVTEERGRAENGFGEPADAALKQNGRDVDDGGERKFGDAQNAPAEGENALRGSRSLRERRVRTPSTLVRANSADPAMRTEYERVPYANSKRYQFCHRLIRDFQRLKDAAPFRVPVFELWSPDALPGYMDVIQKPMDLRTLSDNLSRGMYTRPGVQTPQFDSERFGFDFRLMFRNAMSYNSPGDLVHSTAENLLARFESKFRELPLDDAVAGGTHSAARSDDLIIIPHTAPTGKTTSEGSRSKPVRPPKSHAAKKGNGAKTGAKPNSKSRRIPSDRELLAELLDDGPYEHFNKMTLAEALRKMASLQRQRTALASSNNGRITEQSALYHVNMTYDEKRRLGENIGKLRDDQIVKLLQIVRKRSGGKSAVANEEEEVELDIDSLETGILREMEAYVSSCLFKKKHGAGSAKAHSNAKVAEEVDRQVAALEGVIRTLRAAEAAAQMGSTSALNPYESESSDNSSDHDSSDASSAA